MAVNFCAAFMGGYSSCMGQKEILIQIRSATVALPITYVKLVTVDKFEHPWLDYG
jgi:hypothetical protein